MLAFLGAVRRGRSRGDRGARLPAYRNILKALGC